MKPRYLVITWVPDAEENPDNGNMCHEVLYVVEDLGEYRSDGTVIPQRLSEKRQLVLSPLFEVGEILVVNNYGREINGQGRKPSKWDVRYEEFRSITKAIARAVEVSFK